MEPPPISSASTATRCSMFPPPPPPTKSHTNSQLSRNSLPKPVLPTPQSSIVFPPPLLPRRQTLSSISPSKCCRMRNQGADSMRGRRFLRKRSRRSPHLPRERNRGISLRRRRLVRKRSHRR
ncbi:hypothetical protein LINPERPRIM_LOCUS39822 [Linum perenne]